MAYVLKLQEKEGKRRGKISQIWSLDLSVYPNMFTRTYAGSVWHVSQLPHMQKLPLDANAK